MSAVYTPLSGLSITLVEDALEVATQTGSGNKPKRFHGEHLIPR